MRKLSKILLITLIAVSFLVSFSACSGTQDEDVDKTYTVTFVCDGYENITRTVKHGKKIDNVPNTPEIDGYIVEWQGYDFSTPITKDVTVTAVKRLKEYTITFKCDGYADVVRTVKHGDVFSDLPNVPTIEGYSVAWQTYDFTKPITQNITINAVKTPNEYIISFNLGMRTATIASSTMEVLYGEEYNLLKPTCSGYKFVGWKIEGTNTSFAQNGVYTQLTGLTLVAEWEIDETSSDNWSDGH